MSSVSPTSRSACSSYQSRSITIKRKLEVIDAVKKAPAGKKKREIATDFGFPSASLRASNSFGNRHKIRDLDCTRSDVDKALYLWFTAARAQSIPISGEILKTEAEEFAANDDTGDPLPKVSSQQAMAALSDTQSYVLCDGSDVYCILKDLEIEINNATAKESKQTLITDFVVQ